MATIRAVLAAWVLALFAAATAAARPPSVLVIVADDMRADAIGALGNGHVRTPALDALVDRGVTFDRAYCMGSQHGAVCIASRAMMLAGRSLFRRDERLEGQDTWPEAFSRAGHRTFLAGKWHNGEASAVRCFREGRDVFFGGMTDQWKVPVRSFPAPAGGLGPTTVAAGVHSARLVGDAGVAFLEGLGDEPFFAWVSFTVPHDPRSAPEEFRARYRGHEPPPPANWLPEHPFDNGELAVRDELLLPRPLSREGTSHEIADALACVESLDAEVGRMMATLEARGRLDDTLVLFVSDHGLALGSHGLLGKQNLYEHSARAPAILAGPGVPAGSRVTSLCLLPDLVATAGALAGVAAPEGSEAVSLVPVLRGERPAVRDDLLLAYRHLQRALVTPGWKLVRYPEIGREQLFDLTEDPDEIHDLSTAPAQAPRLADLRARLVGAMHAAADPLAAGAASFAPAAVPVARPPNVIFLLADDLGTGDVGALGSTYAVTPHIDALFARGTRLARHWAGSAVCAPSRCVLMTGLHPGHAPVRSNSEVQPEGQRPMPEGTVTLARLFHDAGHATGGFGKWGLGPPGSVSDPLAAGFDRFFGYNCQRHAHTFYPTTLWDGREKVPLDNPAIPVTASLPADPVPAAADFARFRGTTYSADRITAEALEFVRAHRDEHFFLYLPTTLPHVALQVPDDEPSLARHRAHFGAEPPYLGGKGYVPCAEPAATLAAMITRLDRDVGRIVALLDELGIADDTILVFTSDNGATFPGAGGAATDRMGSHGDLRDWKGSPYEGGLRVPAVVVWPGRVAAGGSIDVPTGCEDWLPTLLDLAGLAARIPAGLDGRSLAPALLGREPAPAPRTLYRELTERRWQAALDHSAAGSWKGVRRARGKDGTEAAPTELYDLVADPGETRDVAADHPDVVARMERILDREHEPHPDWPLPFADAAARAARGGGKGAAEGAGAARPNILWLVAEDLTTRVGCYGDPLARTPTIDALATAGVTFERCFSQPVCAPSRFTLVTGMHAVSCGPAHHMRARATLPDGVEAFPALLRDAGYFTVNNAKTDYNAAIDMDRTWDRSGKRAHWRDRPDDGRPFFAVFNHEVTHESCLFPEEDVALPFPATDPAAVTLPAYLPDTPEIRADWARHADHVALLDRQLAARLAELEADGLADDTIVFFFGDNGGVTPRSKRFLHSSGIRVPLVVRFPPRFRHLAPADPGTRTTDPVGFVDFSATVLALAGVSRPEWVEGRAFAGGDAGERRDPDAPVYVSRDRMDERADMVRALASRRWLYLRSLRPDLPAIQRVNYMFRARGYASWTRAARSGDLSPESAAWFGPRVAEELYDLDADPDNVVNRAADPAARAVLETMRRGLRDRAVALADGGFLPEGSALETPRRRGEPPAWPVERVVDLALAAGGDDGAARAGLRAALGAPAEPERYWAAQGFTVRVKAGGGLDDAERAGLGRLLDDPSVPVRTAAAEALAAAGSAERALDTVGAVLDAGTPTDLHHAAVAIDRMGAVAAPLLPRIRAALARLDAMPEEPAGTGIRPRYPRDLLAACAAILSGEEEPLPRPAPARAPGRRAPNVVFILADDLGWTDLGVQGSGYYRTPHVDRLAADGMRFLSHHACPNCQPTRAALMTGQYGARTGVYTVGNIDRFDWRSRPLRPVDNVTKLPLDRRTIADLLGEAGFATAIFGKWHLGEDARHHPARRGFDEAIVSHGKHFRFETDPPVEHAEEEYLADFLTDRACDFIRRHAREPFFLYVPHFGVHAPLEAKEEIVARFRGTPPAGGHRDPVYAAMIASVDESVGRIRACLEAEGIADDTVIVFSSDNGGRGGYAREGLRGEADATDNAPLRCGKGSLYEGGVRVPLVVRWPGVTRPGSTSDEPTIHVDLFATFLEMAGAAPAEGQPVDGTSLVPLLRDPAAGDRPPIFHHFPGYLGAGPGAWRTTPAGAVQAGSWKLVEFFEEGRIELYDLAGDPGETTNLAVGEPRRARELLGLLEGWRARVGAPMPTRRAPDGVPAGGTRPRAAARRAS